MPSNRNQKAKEKRSRQSDVISDLKNMNIWLAVFSRDDYEVEIEIEMVSKSDELHGNANPIGENFRSLLNTNSGENSEITVETARMVNFEFARQM